MAAPAVADAGGGGGDEFEAWLGDRLDSLEIDREVYGAYLLGVLREVDCDDEEKIETLQGILSAFLEGDALEDVCKQIIDEWTEHCGRSVKCGDEDADVQAITSLMEKQAQMVVKQKELPGDSKTNKEAVLAQYGNITDDEEEGEEDETAAYVPAGDKSLFKNTNVEQVLNRQKEKREQAREDSRKKKETDKTQREKDKVAKQDRKEKEKKRTQKGERKR